ncbi:MAG: ABC transporter ATP-binding protein [Saprospiraceae bacterium]|nr:MAG: ABC transporter ATP-binding protein [Saprospiraceae bacterium]
MLIKYYGKSYDIERLRNVCNITMEGVSARGIIEGAEALGLQALPAVIDYQTLSEQAPLPCITYWKARHFLIVYKIKKNKVYVADPSYGLITFSKEDFIQRWQNRKDDRTDDKGIVILFEPTPEFYKNEDDEESNKGLSVIFGYLGKDRRYLVQIVLGLLAGTIIQFAFPFLTQAIVDQGIATRDVSLIAMILVAQITLYLSSSLFSLIQGWLLLFVGSKASILISTDYLRKLLRKSVSFFDSKTSGDILQRINDSSRVERLITSAPTTIFSYFNACVFLLVLLYYDLTIFLVFLGGASLYILWIQFFMKKREELDFKRFSENASTNTSLIQIVNGIQEVKVNNSELRRIWGWEEARTRLYKNSISNLKLAQIQTIGANSINELKNITITFLAATGVVRGDITLGMMLAIQYMVGQINVPLSGMIQFFRQVQDARLSLERYTDIDFLTDEEKLMNRKDLIQPPLEPSDIVLENLSFRYGGHKSPMVLKNINLSIPKGKVTAIVGMSGGGKTTLLKLLLKLYLPTEGTIRIGNVNMNAIDTRTWRQQIGSVMQNGYIFTDTVARNITESKSFGNYDEKRILEAVKVANIHEFIESHPAGYNARIGPPGASGRSLSGGEAQRILLARAIYKDPKYIFLDEATSALDANNEMEIMNNLATFFKGKTVIIIAHRLSTVRDADQIIVLKNGEAVEVGNHQELLGLNGHYYTLIKNQLEVGK